MSEHTTEGLEFWEGMFGNAVTAKGGNYTISYQEFMDRFTAQQLALLDEVEKKIANNKPLTTVDSLINLWEDRNTNSLAALRLEIKEDV